MHPQIERNRRGPGRAQEVRLPLHQRAAAASRSSTSSSPAKYLTFSVHLDGQKEHHDFAVCREGGYDMAVEGIREAVTARLPRHHQHHAVRRRRPGARARVLRRDDGPRRRGHDALARLRLRQGARTRSFLGKRDAHAACSATILSNRKRSWNFNQSPLFLEFLMGRARLRLHAVGHADLQRLRLAEALLPAAGRLRRDLRAS